MVGGSATSTGATGIGSSRTTAVDASTGARADPPKGVSIGFSTAPGVDAPAELADPTATTMAGLIPKGSSSLETIRVSTCRAQGQKKSY